MLQDPGEDPLLGPAPDDVALEPDEDEDGREEDLVANMSGVA